MLVLERKPSDGFEIGSDVNVRVIEVSGKRVRIGIDAPRALPIIRDDAKAKHAPPLSAPGQLTTVRVMIVEDDDVHASIISQALAGCDIGSVLRASSAEAARTCFDRMVAGEEPPPDIILLDLKLGPESGLSVLRAKRRIESLKHVPTIVLTSSELDNDMSEALRLGANAYLIKEANMDRLGESIYRTIAFWVMSQRPRESITAPAG